MAVHFNTRAKRVTSDDIYSITLLNTTVNTSTDINGGFVFEGYHTVAGCGGVETGILITLKDNISWTRISFKWEGSGTASCWSFMDPSNGAYGASTGNPSGNMLSYNESLGDRLYDNYLTWEVSAYQSHNRTYACDNNADNFFRYNSGELKRFRMSRRRNVNGSLAAIHHGRSCNSTGAGSVTRISDIFIW